MKKIDCQGQIGGIDASGRQITHLGGAGQQDFPETASLGSEVDIDLAAIMRIAHTLDQPPAFHAVQSSDSRRLHHADALAEFALGQSVFVPQRSKKEPLTHAYAMGSDL